jgi:hypothetical protein
MNTEWITDRLPTAEDALTDGSVWTFYDGKVMIWSYDGVELGTPWQPITKLAPYVKPKRWTVEFSQNNNTWMMRDNFEGWVRLLYIDRFHAEAAQRIADIYNEVRP